MILGMSTAAFTLLHVVISLVGIFAGLVALFGMCRARLMPFWTVLFLVTTIATSVTGFFFHFTKIGPSHVFGVISLVLLALSLAALFVYRLAGSWRWIYVVTAVLALYLNVFVGVVQSFQKLGFLHPLAPNGNEPPFAIAQAVVLLAFVLASIVAVRKFRTA